MKEGRTSYGAPLRKTLSNASASSAAAASRITPEGLKPRRSLRHTIQHSRHLNDLHVDLSKRAKERIRQGFKLAPRLASVKEQRRWPRSVVTAPRRSSRRRPGPGLLHIFTCSQARGFRNPTQSVESTGDCGTWFQEPRRGSESQIRARFGPERRVRGKKGGPEDGHCPVLPGNPGSWY